MKANLTREQLGLKSLRYGSEASLPLSTGLKYHIRGQTDRYSAFLSFSLSSRFQHGFHGVPLFVLMTRWELERLHFNFDHFVIEELLLKTLAGEE